MRESLCSRDLGFAWHDDLTLDGSCLDSDPWQDGVIPLWTLPFEVLEHLCPLVR